MIDPLRILQIGLAIFAILSFLEAIRIMTNG
jgi:hypothetical protein